MIFCGQSGCDIYQHVDIKNYKSSSRSERRPVTYVIMCGPVPAYPYSHCQITPDGTKETDLEIHYHYKMTERHNNKIFWGIFIRRHDEFLGGATYLLDEPSSGWYQNATASHKSYTRYKT